ncbi:MAG TPA: hypothetical protein DD473_08210 [Planctomycetaceae bacterium]|nr:hypothetical protein [Planctomycetaceae bacterium]|tara:strand:- start:58 stop:414 length:357 start_codon:yes stop_codon:yes gene_type:complete
MPYETIRDEGESEMKFKDRVNGYAHLKIILKPIKELLLRIVVEVNSEDCPEEFLLAAAEGMRETGATGVVKGYPVLGIEIVISKARYHERDSTVTSFHYGGKHIFRHFLLENKIVVID